MYAPFIFNEIKVVKNIYYNKFSEKAMKFKAKADGLTCLQRMIKVQYLKI